MTGVTTYNLLDEPWIMVLDTQGEVTTVSILEALERAGKLRRIVGEIPTQEVAILRLLLAILHRALPHEGDDEEARAEWARWWNAGGVPVDEVVHYLAEHRDRFDLLHVRTPFFQVADLHTAKGSTSGLSKLIAEIPAGHQFFTTRTVNEAGRLTYAEAARWLVHTQAYDPSGIKSGAVGDHRVKGGKGYPIGIGWSGNLGVVVLEGATLAETLLLNLVHDRPETDDDMPPWEGPQATAAPTGAESPWGPVQAMTWQIRRVRLMHDGEGVRDAVISNGDPIRLRNQHQIETMSGWRRSKAQQTKHKEATVYMARGHQEGRAIWRGLGSLIAAAPVATGSRAGEDALESPTLTWIASLRHHGALPAGYPVTLHAVGAVYGSNNSVIDNVISDRLRLRAEVLAEESLQSAAVRAADAAIVGARLLGRFASNLAMAAGREGGPDGQRAVELALSRFDRPFRAWVAELSLGKRAAAEEEWRGRLRRMTLRAGQELYDRCSPQAIQGRIVQDRNKNPMRLDAALAHAWFTRQLTREVPLERDPKQEEHND